MVALDKFGQFKWQYTTGDNQKSFSVKFYPADISVTTDGLILISDRDNNCIHVLNQTRGLVYCYQISTLGLELPYSLAIDVSGFIWVGCAKWAGDNTKRGKIYKLEFKKV